MEDFSANEEGTRSIAQTKSDHLNEGEDDGEDMQLWHEDLYEGNQ